MLHSVTKLFIIKLWDKGDLLINLQRLTQRKGQIHDSANIEYISLYLTKCSAGMYQRLCYVPPSYQLALKGPRSFQLVVGKSKYKMPLFTCVQYGIICVLKPHQLRPLARASKPSI